MLTKCSLALLLALALLGAASLEGAAADAGCSSAIVACTTEYAPVCGSDGKTYSNKCQLTLAQCTTPDLTLRASGECAADGSVTTPSTAPTTSAPSPSSSPSPTSSSGSSCGSGACPSIYAPVCGSDGKTYSSECNLKVAKCAKPTLDLMATGECATGSGSSGDSKTIVPSPSPSPSNSSSSPESSAGSRANAGEVVVPAPTATAKSGSASAYAAAGVHAVAAVVAGMTCVLVAS